MKVDMEVREDKLKTGMFSSVPVFKVRFKVEFTEAEKVAMRKSGVMDATFMTYPMHPHDKNGRDLHGDERAVPVSLIVNNGGWEPYYKTRIEAQNALSYIEDQFRLLKENITAVDAPKTKSLEL